MMKRTITAALLILLAAAPALARASSFGPATYGHHKGSHKLDTWALVRAVRDVAPPPDTTPPVFNTWNASCVSEDIQRMSFTASEPVTYTVRTAITGTAAHPAPKFFSAWRTVATPAVSAGQYVTLDVLPGAQYWHAELQGWDVAGNPSAIVWDYFLAGFQGDCE